MPSKLSRFCDAVLEASWLGAIILTPLFFNVYSARVFEPDKLTLLRSLVLVMIVAWVTKVVDGKEWEKVSSGRSIWRIPMVLPVAILALVYLLTTALSITPRVSLLGSYQRLQGTYSTLSYLVVFAMLLMHLRSKEQLNRLITTIIITSVPISLYGLIQKYGLDPLPWGGDVTNRIASNLGNAIFVSAYIIMVTPLVFYRIIESFTAILTDDVLDWADVIRASLYIFIAALHLLAMIFSQSRGPLLGFLASSFTMILILLVRLRESAKEKGRIKLKEVGMAFGVLLLIDLASFAILYLVTQLATGQGWIAADPAAFGSATELSAAAFRAAMVGGISFLGAVVGGLIAIFILAASRRGWRWLWLSLILQAVVVGGFLVVFNVPNSPIADWRHLPYVGRLGTMLDTEHTTSKVRAYIWQGVIEMVTPHEPLEFPGGRQDSLNAIRPLIGYGPESMYVAYNRFYVPELAHVEKRNASPDRSHNETFDSLVITGLLGFLAWQAVYGALFYYGFRWLGVIRSKRDSVLFFALLLGVGLVSAIGFGLWLGPEFIGVAFPFGELAGLLAYLAIFAMFSTTADEIISARNFALLTALLSAAVAHFAEIHFGIAIAATRTYFFTYAALLVLLGYVLPRQAAAEAETASADNQPSRRSQKRRRRKKTGTGPQLSWWQPVLVGAIAMGLILGTMGYEFIGSPTDPNTQEILGNVQVVWQSLIRNGADASRPTYATLGMMTLTALVGGALVVTEASKQKFILERGGSALKSILLYLGGAGAIGFFYMLFQADRLRFLAQGAGIATTESAFVRLREAADATAGLLDGYYVLVFGIVVALALILARSRSDVGGAGSFSAWSTLVVGAALALYLINTSNLDVVRADTVYKQADPWDQRAQVEQNTVLWDLAIAEYNHALEYAPHEDFYYLWLGRAYLEKSTLMDDAVAQQQLMEVARDQLLQARQINPLNTDHSANLARLYTRWAEFSTSDVERTAKANQADAYYADAHSLSPQNAVILNEWAMLEAGLFGDCDTALTQLEQSLAIDDQYSDTYLKTGNVALTCGDRSSEQTEQQGFYQDAVVAYQQVISMTTCDLQAYTALGYAHSQLGNLEDAIQTNLDGIACSGSPAGSQTIQLHRNLAILYSQQEDMENAVVQAQAMAQSAGSNVASLLDAANLLRQLGALQETYQVLQQIIALAPQNWSQLADLAALLSDIGLPEEALPYAQQALELAPENQAASVQSLIDSLQNQLTP